MSTTHKPKHKVADTTKKSKPAYADSGREALRSSPTMARLIDALESGEDIGHYGHLTVAMVARHFMIEADVTALLAPQMGAEKAEAMVLQVQAKEYNPPKRDRLLEFSARQDYCLVPDPADPDSGNLYRELEFPAGVYEHITEYYQEKAAAE